MPRQQMLVLLLLLAGVLAGCGGQGTRQAPADSPTADRLRESARLPKSAASATSTVVPSATPTAVPSATPTVVPSATPTAVPPATPTDLPPAAPVPGEPLASSLKRLLDADGHLTAGLAAELGGRPVYVVASLGRSVTCFDETGSVLWRARTAGPAYALALLDGERVAAGDDAGQVTLFDAGGRRQWRTSMGSRVTVLRAWQGGLLAGGWDERLSLFDVTAGGESLRWQAALDGPLTGIAARGDLAAAATLDGRVSAFDPGGAEVWRLEAGAPVVGLGALDLGAAPIAFVAGLQDGRLLALDRAGTVLWQQDVGEGSPVWAALPPGAADGEAVLAVGSGAGGRDRPALSLLSAQGELLWRVALPAAAEAVAAPDLDGDARAEIVVGLADGRVLALDGDGRLRGTVHAGLHVWDLVPSTSAALPPLVLADLVAWRLDGRTGAAGGPVLRPPAMLAAPPPLADEASVPGQATLVFLGDVSPSRTMEAQLARYGPAYPWAGLEPLLAGADLAVANLEAVLSTAGRPINKTYLLRGHPRWAEMLAAGSLDLVSLANNHVLDYGEAGLDATLQALAGVGIASVGVGPAPGEAPGLALFTLNGVRVAVLGHLAARWKDSADVPTSGTSAARLGWDDPAQVQAGVRAVRDRADIVVVVVHNGAEYAPRPSESQAAVARAAIDAGANLVVGHHPHVTQTTERYGGGLIVYSLGNAVFDILRPAAMTGDLLRVVVDRQGLVRAELWPFWIDDAIRPRLLDDGQGASRMTAIYP